MKLTRELWQQIDPLLSDALEMEKPAREAWLRGLEQTHPQLTGTLRELLLVHDRAERDHALETVPGLAPPPSSAFAAGARVGPFALVRLLGRGGMGEVWLARQVDGRVEREVALKLPTSYLHGDVWRERFRRERDILARLAHPNIARLCDAGVSDEDGSRGQPYLAMEYVEGAALGDHVAGQRSSVRQRLDLFRQILAAVAHAHRHLVVHRDLKPANILIDQGGQVKLLDFGIAKLIDDGAESVAAALTQLGGRLMTLRYAAPEQVAEGPITTATDTYALGVILHELLTGLSPYRAVREGLVLTETALLGEEPVTPSRLALDADAAAVRGATSPKALAQSIAGDLDAIVLKALRRNPADRYASVEQLDQDILRHLDRRPVKAREGTWRYLAGRFAARHRLSIVAAAIVLLTMLAGLAMVEQQRRVAIAEKARAEKHFASVRKLANSLIFDVHDQIKNLPGATPAKLTLIDNVSRYLAQLAPEAGTDPAFRRELAEAYLRLGNIQGQYGGQNVGKPDEALRNFEQAIDLLTPVPESPLPQERARSSELIGQVYRQKSQLLFDLGRKAESIDAARAGLTLAAALAASPQASAQQRLAHARMLVEYTRRQSELGDRNLRLRGLEQGLEIADAVYRSLPQDGAADLRRDIQEDIAWMSSEMGHFLRWDKDPAVKRRAIQKFREALDIRQAALRDAPNDVTRRRAIVAHYTFIGSTLSELGEDREALDSLQKAVVGMQKLAAEDPENVQYRRDVFVTMHMLANAQLKAKQHEDVVRTADGSYALAAQLPDTVRRTRAIAENLADLMLLEAEARIALSTRAVSPASRRSHLAGARHRIDESQRVSASIDAGQWRAGKVSDPEHKVRVERLLGSIREVSG